MLDVSEVMTENHSGYFPDMDTDASGTINIKELIDFLTAVGGEIDKDEVTDISNMSLKNLYFLFQIREIFLSLDDSGDRLIDFEELKVRSFVQKVNCTWYFYKEVMGQLKKKGWVKDTKKADEISEEEIRKVFDIVDKDKSGSLSKREAKRACKLI